MTDEEANAIAKQHLAENPLPHADYRWRPTDGREFGHGWYFDYAFEPVRPIPEHELEHFGGAPGLIVLRDGTVRNVSWSEFSARREPNGRSYVGGPWLPQSRTVTIVLRITGSHPRSRKARRGC